jgi:outer membrane protein
MKISLKHVATLACLHVRPAGRCRLAQELKIGYVNSERVLRELAACARPAQTKLEAEFGTASASSTTRPRA